MRGAEERIKGHLPKAMRSAVYFQDGQVTCDWDDRTAWRYEDTFGCMTIWSGGHEQDITDVAADAAKRLGPHIIERVGDGSTIITTTQGTVCLPGKSTNRRGDGSVQATVDTARWSGSVRLEPGSVLPAYVIWDLSNRNN